MAFQSTPKKNRNTLFVFLLLTVFSTTARSQVLISSGFEDATEPNPPAGWTVTTPNGTANWQSLYAEGGFGNSYEGEYCMYLAAAYNDDKSDAWLISPSFTAEAGKKYSISFYYKNQSNSANRFEITLGSDATPASQTEVISQFNFRDSRYVKAQINYTATSAGVKYLGIHCVTEHTLTYAYIDKFEIAAVSCFEPTNLKVTGIDTSSARAVWDAVSADAKYEYGISESATTPPTATTSTNNKEALITGLKSGTPHYLYVRARCDASTASTWAITKFGTAYNPAFFPVVNCGTKEINDFISTEGIYQNSLCDLDYGASEFFHKFTPAQSGDYYLNIYEVNTGQAIAFGYKDSALGSGPDGWTCIGYNYSGIKFKLGPLEAGKTYYIMQKAARIAPFPSYYSWGIDCYYTPPANDDCDKAVTIVSGKYNDACEGTLITTIGATPGSLNENYENCGSFDNIYNDEVWFKFTATADQQLFRFKNMAYTNDAIPGANPGMVINIFKSECNLNSLVDCGYFGVNPGETKDIYSYKLKTGETYYCRIFTGDATTYATFNLCIMDLAVTAGNDNICTPGLTYTIDEYTDNNNTSIWVPFTDDSYKLIGAINARGNNLGFVTPNVYVNKGAVRQDANGNYYLDRSFSFQTDFEPSTTASVRLLISNAELAALIAQPGSGVTSVKDLRVIRNSDECSSTLTSAAENIIVPKRTGDYNEEFKYLEFETPGFSSFYLQGDVVLPAQLISFTGAVNNNNVTLTWKTSQEINTKNFIVERSSDARNFTQAGSIAAHGNTASENTYRFIDSKLSKGTYYYRLTVVDNDGQQKFSKIIPVHINGAGGIDVNPNPVKDKLNISTNEEKAGTYHISIINIKGQVVSSFTKNVNAGYNQITLDLSTVAKGVYVLKMTASGETKITKIIKE